GRRQSSKFSGASYAIQVGAAACYTDSGRREVRANIDYYMENARLIREGIAAAGLRVFGGENAPYAWIATPKGVASWDMFDRLLQEAHVVCTPGAGFGACGEGYLRLSAFGTRGQVEEGMERGRKARAGQAAVRAAGAGRSAAPAPTRSPRHRRARTPRAE